MFLCSSVKRRTNWHRHDYTEPDDGSKPVQAGTAVFISQLQNRSFARYTGETPLDIEIQRDVWYR